MGNSNTNTKEKSVQPTTKKKIPTKFMCPIAKRIMMNPQRIICSGNVYDALSICQWIESGRTYDPIAGTPFVAPDGKLLRHECTELKQEIEQFLNDNEHYKQTQLINDNVDWNKLFIQCDEKKKQKVLRFQHLYDSLLIKGHCLLFPNATNKNIVEWDTDLLLLLSTNKIPIITFIGAARQGKSTLLNDILGLNDNPAFEMSNSPDVAQTKGAWAALYNYKSAKLDVGDEKKNDELGSNSYHQSFFLLDMEGITHQFTAFTEKVFYCVYCFSDVIVWNDKSINSKYFQDLMIKLKSTMSNIGESSNKPSFLYLRRDKDDFFDFGEHKTFDKYINHSESFKTFRDLSLFSAISGYQLSQRPSSTKPFSIETLKELTDIIFTLNKNSSEINKDSNRFIPHYHELQKQFNHINKHGMLSLGTQIILEHDVLQWFLFDDDQMDNEKKMLLYAQKHNFSEKRMSEEFNDAINDPKFLTFEQRGIIDVMLKDRLIKNKDIMLQCVDKYRDKLNMVGALPKLAFGIAPGVVGVIAGLATGLTADVVAYTVLKNHEFGIYSRKGGQIGVKIGETGMKVGQFIEKGVETSIQYWNESYSRYQIRSKNSFAVKLQLTAKQAIPLFINSESDDEQYTHYIFDRHLLSLVSRAIPIILFIGSKTVNISTLLNKISDTNRFVESEPVKIPVVIYQNGGLFINMPPWNDDINSKKMFYSLYFLVDIIVWHDTTMKSEDFESFAKVLEYEMNYAEEFNRKPSFTYVLHGSKLYCDTHIKKHNSFSSFRNMKLFSAISGYNLPDMESDSLDIFCPFIGKQSKKGQTVAFCSYRKTDVEGDECPTCSKIWTALSGTQCEHCGDLNFNQEHNNEYSLYRQLLHIDKYDKLSIELQLIMDDGILKYFLYEEDDEYQEKLMWQLAKNMQFNKKTICELFESCEPQKYIHFYQQLVTGKELLIYALSSDTKEWRSPLLSPPITLDQNKHNCAVYGYIREIQSLFNPPALIEENIFKLCCFYYGTVAAEVKIKNDYLMVKDYFDKIPPIDQNPPEIKQNDNKENQEMNQSVEPSIQILPRESEVNMEIAKNEIINISQMVDKFLLENKVEQKQNAMENNIKLVEKEIKEQSILSPEESARNQMYNFLKRIRLQNYFDKFKDDDCYDIESIVLYDDESLEEDIEMKRTARKRFLMHVEKVKTEMNIFSNKYGISTILYNRLAAYGIVTIGILCSEVKNKSDLKRKFQIVNEHQCHFLWNLVQKQENCDQNNENITNIKSNEGTDTEYVNNVEC